MSSMIQNYNYDIFISYRQKDNKGDKWVSEFVEALKTELESTFKEDISVYFDINPHDGLLETHDVDESLKEKLKCLVFIPIISRTYCDPKSFAWEHEFKAFVDLASNDQFGLKVKLPNGNVASRVLPIRIHNLDIDDIKQCEIILGGVLRSIEFIYKEPGVNKPLTSDDDVKKNLNNTKYGIQINKTANAIKEIISGLNKESVYSGAETEEITTTIEKPVPQEKSIIVLPFENISPDPDQEYFSDGLTEEVITDLSHIHDLLVISRSSAMTFKGTKSTVKEIAKKVDVQYVLEGSVRKSGNNLRITAQLIEASTDTHLWAEKYSGTLDDVFDIQEKVSRSIVDSLKIKLSSDEEMNIQKRKIDNAKAFEQYLMAIHEIWKITKESLSHAIQLLTSKLESIGKNEYLLIALGTAYFQYVNAGIDPDEKHLDKANELIEEALSLNPDLSKAYYLRSMIQETRGEIRKAFISSKRAVELDPNDSEAMAMLGFLYTLVGKPEEAKPYAKHAIEVDPLYPLAYVAEWWINLSEGRFDIALETCIKMYCIDQDNLLSAWAYAHALVCNNKLKEAKKLLNSMTEKYSDQPWALLGKALRHAINKEKQEALKSITEKVEKTAEMDHVTAWWLADVLALIGEKDKAIHYLERATRDNINYPLFSKYDPLLENIRGDERFKKLMERVKHEWENFEV